MHHNTTISNVANFGLDKPLKKNYTQWWIHDFPQEGAPTLGGGGGRCQDTTLLKYPEKCMKLKKIRHPGGGGHLPLHPPLDPPLVLIKYIKLKCNSLIPHDIYFHIYSPQNVQKKQETANVCEYKVGNNANIATFV